MLELIGAVLVILGILGLVDVLGLGDALSIVLIVVGALLIAWAQGLFTRLRR